MKKRFLAMLVTVAMLAAMLTPIGSMAADPEVTKTHFDIDFESWTTGNFGSGKNSDGTAIYHDWSGAEKLTIATDSAKNSKVLKAALETSNENSSGYMARTRMNYQKSNDLPNYTLNQVLWNEFSIKYEGGFIGFGSNENANGYSIISINKDGQLELGSRFAYMEVGGSGYEKGTVISDVQLQLGQWYDIKVAADFTAEGAAGDAGVPTYVWLNGTLISEGVRIPNIRAGWGWGYQKLYFDMASKENSVAYVDDIKVYDTAALGDIENPDDSGDSGNTGDSDITVVPGFNNTEAKTKTHFDIDFESWTTGNFGSGKNSDGTAIYHDWSGAEKLTIATDSAKNSKVLKAALETSNENSSGYMARTRMNYQKSNDLPNYTLNQVLWNEFSIKYEGGFIGFGSNENANGYSIISINKDGQLELGSRFAYMEVGGSGYEKGTVISDVQLQLGQWYDIKVAADFTAEGAAGDAGVPTYVWLNGTLISEGVRIPNIRAGWGWGYQKLYFDMASKENSVAYVDDIKVYDTAAVGNDVGEKETINVMREALNSIETSISTVSYEWHPASEMVDGVKEGDHRYKSQRIEAEADGLTVVAALDGVYSISSVILTEAYWESQDNGLTVTIEIGKNGVLTKVVDAQAVNKGSGNDNACETKYEFGETEGDTIVYTLMATKPRPNDGDNQADYNIYEIEAYGTYVEPVAKTGFVPEIGFWFRHTDNTIANYYISAHNAGDEDIPGKLFVAAYNDDNELMAVSLKEVTLCTGANILGGSLVYDNLLSNPAYTYKAFFFDSTTAAPILAPVNVIK